MKLQVSASVCTDIINHITEFANEAITARGFFRIALSGGSLINILNCKSFNSLDFSKWRVFLADERCVAIDSPDSTFGAYLRVIPNLPNKSDFYLDNFGAEDPEKLALNYEKALGDDFMDLTILGIGPDGHTASLFPGKFSTATDRKILAILDSPKPPAHRITMSLPYLSGSRHLLFVACGESKAAVLHQIIDLKDQSLPVTLLLDKCNDCIIIVDSDAASSLTSQ